jgi:hypothetical protein
VIERDRLFCAHCQRRAVEITRNDARAGVHCHACDRRWSYANNRLSDETLLRSFAAQATTAQEDRDP